MDEWMGRGSADWLGFGAFVQESAWHLGSMKCGVGGCCFLGGRWKRCEY